ncbi:MAG: hybrid sensor histidine kinase/response regulator, partial [Puniceicoccales bacterium]
VDDQPRNLQLLGNALFKNGYDVALACSGSEALELIGESPPDLVLLDVMMPEMDGFEVCRRLKESQIAPDLEVIFVTAKTQKEDILQGFTVGGVDYITKPIQIPEVLARVKSQVSLKFAKDELRSINRKLSRVIENQQRFLSILSHDVRAPLYGLNNLLSEALENEEELSQEDFVEMVKTCEDSSRRLSSFFEDALVWARNEAGGYEEKAVPFSLCDAYHSVRSLLLPLFDKKKVELVANIDAGAAVVCQSNAFATVLRNLLSNAVKYSDPGSRVTFIGESLEDSIRITIADEGVGMSALRIESLFDPEARKSTLGTGREKGAGVGLILCQSLIESMGGKLSVESEEGRGSRFSFEVNRFRGDPD